MLARKIWVARADVPPISRMDVTGQVSGTKVSLRAPTGYVEMAGALQKVLTVAKMRGSAHSREWRAYEITAVEYI